MIKAIFYFIMIVPLLALSSCSKSGSSQANASLQNVAKDFTAAFNTHDPNAMADFWTDDGDLLSPWAGIITGKQEIEKHFATDHADTMKDAQIHLDVQNIRLIDPETAFVDADLTITGMTVAGEKAVPFRNHAIYLFVKKDGKWRILIARPY